MRSSIVQLITLFCCCLPYFHSLPAQDIRNALQDYVAAYHLEKVYVAHDKPLYIAGDTIWSVVHLVDGRTHRAFQEPAVVYVNWIDPDGVIKNNFTLQVRGGMAELDIPTSGLDTAGLYTLRAYTQYQRNFPDHYLFQKRIRLINSRGPTVPDAPEPTDFSLKFYPEGGDLVAGLASTVAFKAQNDLGQNIEVAGQITNQDGEKVGDLVSLHEGMGLFRFTPQASASYEARVRYRGVEKRFRLPEAQSEGYLIKANTHSLERLSITLESNVQGGLEGAVVLGHLRGQVFFSQMMPAGNKESITLKKSDLPSGLLHFTLFDPQQRPVAERLIFNKNESEAVTVQLETDSLSFGRKSPVRINIRPLNGDSVIAGRMSLSVYDARLFDVDRNKLTLQNYLLLQSDLRGRINNIDQYFTENSSKVNNLLDLLLMTHGWRRFSWQQVLAGRRPKLLYPAEEHLSIAGKITDWNKDKPIKAKLLLNVLSEEQFAALELTTGEDGLFYFTGFDFRDTTDILLQANKYRAGRAGKRDREIIERKGSSYVDIQRFELEEMPVNDSIGIPSANAPTDREKALAYEVEQYRNVDTGGQSLWTIDLSEVTVRSGLNRAQLQDRAFQQEYREKGLFYFHSTEKFRADDPQYDDFRHNDIFDLIQVVVPQAKRLRVEGRPTIVLGRLSQNAQPKIALDGQLVPIGRLEIIDPDHISIIEVVRGDYAKALYGTAPVLSLISKDPAKIKRPNPGVIAFAHPGYYQAREFYSPNYAQSQATETTDFRSTLFWEPTLTISDQAAMVAFYTGDLAGEYLIWVEGISEVGVPFTGMGKIQVRN